MLTQCVNDTRLGVMFKQRQGMLGHGLPLGAYLLKPIQRVLKYHLLLQVRHSVMTSVIMTEDAFVLVHL